MKKLLLTIAALTIFTVFNQSYSQDKWSLELRTGTNYATQNIADADLGLGFGAELTIAYRFMPHLAAYADGVITILLLINLLRVQMQVLKKPDTLLVFSSFIQLVNQI
jgi:hypothetical protein